MDTAIGMKEVSKLIVVANSFFDSHRSSTPPPSHNPQCTIKSFVWRSRFSLVEFLSSQISSLVHEKLDVVHVVESIALGIVHTLHPKLMMFLLKSLGILLKDGMQSHPLWYRFTHYLPGSCIDLEGYRDVVAAISNVNGVMRRP